MTPLFHLAPSAIRLSRRFAFPGACSVKLATTSELTMADPPSAQSDEMDAVSIDSDRAEPGAADANRLVRPLRVKSASGKVTNALALVAGHHDLATLEWGGTGAAPMIVLDYGRDVGGIPVFDALAFPMAHRHYAPFTAKVSLSCYQAATDASFSRLAFQPEPAARSASLTSSSSALQVDGHNGEAQKNATALGGTCERCPPAGATLTWGPDGEHAPNRGDRNRPVRSPEAGPDIYCRGPWTEDGWQNASTQFIH